MGTRAGTASGGRAAAGGATGRALAKADSEGAAGGNPPTRGGKRATGTVGATVDKGSKGTGDSKAAKGTAVKGAPARKGAPAKAEQSEQGLKQSGKRAAPNLKRPQDKPVDTSARGVAADDKKAGGGQTADRNRSAHAAKKATYALENSEQETPSRKSTRRSANRIKPDSQLKRRQTRATTSPKARAAKAQANAVKAG
jgi:hypothetical protein